MKQSFSSRVFGFLFALMILLSTPIFLEVGISKEVSPEFTSLRVAGVQMFVSSELEENLNKIINHIRTVDAEIILFPELSLHNALAAFTQQEREEAWAEIAKTCGEAQKMAFIGTWAQQGGETTIQTRIYSKEGTLFGTYDKMVPTRDDRKECVPGKSLHLFEHKGVPFGTLICNDLWVTPGFGSTPDPRLTYQLGEKGAKVIFHAICSGSDQTYTAYHESNLLLRALESKVYICTANIADPRGPVNAASGVVGPDGTWLIQAPREGEQVYTFDLRIPIEQEVRKSGS